MDFGSDTDMIFVNLFKFRKKPTRQGASEFETIGPPLMKNLTKGLSNYWTLGKYDAVAVYEAPDVKNMMEFLVGISEEMKSETLVAEKDYQDLIM